MTFGASLSPFLDKPTVDLKNYQSMISSLLYLTASRPNIMFGVRNCAIYEENPQ